MADPKCRVCYDDGIIFDKNDLAIPCPMCDAWMQPERSVVERERQKGEEGEQQTLIPAPKSPKGKGKGKSKGKGKKGPKKSEPVKIDLTHDDMGDFFDDLYDIDDDDPSTWGAWWDDDGDFDFEDLDFDIDSPFRPTDIGTERSQRGRNPRPIQNWDSGSSLYKFKPTLPAHEYVKDIPETPKREGDWFDYDTRWFNDGLNSHVLHTVRTLTEAYPVTKNWFRGIRVSDVPPTACVVPNDRAIWLTPSLLDKPNSSSPYRRTQPEEETTEGEPIELLKKRLNRLIAHEFGHVLHASILADSAGKEALPDLDMNDLLGRNYKGDSLSHPDSPATYIMEEGKRTVDNPYITGYAETDELERFAEAMTEHWTNARPPELASYVGSNIDFLYHRDKGLNKANAYTSWWETAMDDQDKRKEYEDWWQKSVTASKVSYGAYPLAAETVESFIHSSLPSWGKKEYANWYFNRLAKISSFRPEVLYHVASMKKRDDLLNAGIEPTVMFSNETDARVAAHERSEIEPQDIWYIDPEGLNIERSDSGWKVGATVTVDNIMQIEGWDPEKNGHPLERLAAEETAPEEIRHEDEHQQQMKFAGRINDVEYYIASCTCGWTSNIRSASAADNAWRRHSDSLNESRRRDLAGPPRRGSKTTLLSLSKNWKTILQDK